MASAVLASQNEPNWAHMGKIPYSNHHLNPNPNPNPKKKQKQFHNAAAGRYHNNNVDSPSVTQTASDDAYSFNQTSTSRNAFNSGAYVRLNLASCTKYEARELAKRLSLELEQVRDLQDRIDSGQLSSGNPRSHAKLKKISGNKRPIAAFDSVPTKPCNGLGNRNFDAANYEALFKECRQIVTKLLKHKFGYVFKTPVDVDGLGLHDYHLIVKRPMDLGTVKTNLAKNLYPTPVDFAADVRLTFNNAMLYNPKNDPVHAMADQMLMRFEELFRPIQEKIDSCLSQRRGREFQEFRVNDEMQFQGNEELQEKSWNNRNQSLVSPIRGKKVEHKASPVQVPQFPRKIERMQMPMQAHSSASTPSNSHPPSLNHQPKEDLIPSPVREPLMQVQDQKVGRVVGSVKQPKPRAKDLNKREMSMEEKQKLGTGLQSLPQEKMPQLVQIIRKRNDRLAQDGDEIELDIEALDTETLWELDRFVTNWKKLVSKTKRQALMMSNDPAAAITAPSTPNAEADTGPLSDRNDDDLVKKLKDNDDEDVDIDDDMPATSFPPVEIEKDEGTGVGVGDGQDNDLDDQGHAGSSSSGTGSSSSDSSSSSESDSGSSSGSDSDADDAQS